MSSYAVSIYEAVAEQTGLKVNEQAEVLTGEYHGYNYLVTIVSNYYTVYTSVRKNGELPSKEDLKAAKREVEGVSRPYLSKNYLTFQIYGVTKKSTIKKIISVICTSAEFLKSRGYENACGDCGKKEDDLSFYLIGGSVACLCNACHEKVGSELQQAQILESEKPENVVFGTVGAILGALVGLVAILLISQLGYISVLGGLAMGICTIFAYEKFGGKINTKGIVISSIVMIIMTYVAATLAITIDIDSELGWGIGAVYSKLWILADAADMTGEFVGEIIKFFLFTALGAFPMILNSVKAKAVQYNDMDL